jgi:hypothetical protein
MSVFRTSSAPPGSPLLAAQKSMLLGRYGASLRDDFMYLHNNMTVIKRQLKLRVNLLFSRCDVLPMDICLHLSMAALVHWSPKASGRCSTRLGSLTSLLGGSAASVDLRTCRVASTGWEAFAAEQHGENMPRTECCNGRCMSASVHLQQLGEPQLSWLVLHHDGSHARTRLHQTGHLEGVSIR